MQSPALHIAHSGAPRRHATARVGKLSPTEPSDKAIPEWVIGNELISKSRGWLSLNAIVEMGTAETKESWGSEAARSPLRVLTRLPLSYNDPHELV